MTRRTRLLIATVVAGIALVGPGNALAQENTRLFAKVGPGFEITIRDAAGARVTQLAPGTYDVVVDDASDEHNFHLDGPGVDRRTAIEFVGSVTWTVTLTNGTYVYLCDPHSTTMRGSFRVGAAPPPARPVPRLVATVGPGATISLRTASGARVSSLAARTYRITVRDRSSRHNFHLVGPGLNRRTGVAFRGTVTWTVRVRSGVYRYVCDPHARGMRGTFRGR